MIEIKIYNVIANKRNEWWYCWGEDEHVFSLQAVKDLFENNPEETDFKFNIHCPGGEVNEGLAIYDAIRTSGKNIHMNIEGDCHSMAVTLLLAAPLENRTANPNCLALIHKVYGWSYGGTADELEAAAAETRMLQNKILDIYADRTNKSREELEAIMNEEKTRTAQELLDWGFIGRLNTYNTNLGRRKANNNINKTLSMSEKKKNIKTKTAEFINSVLGILGTTAMNYEFVDENGEVLFSTDAEDDTLEVGMTASPDGTFTLTDGRVVTITDGVITEIKEPEEDGGETQEELENLRREYADLKGKLNEAVTLIKELRSEIKSNYQPQGRLNTTTTNTKTLTSEERKAKLKENVKKGSKK